MKVERIKQKLTEILNTPMNTIMPGVALPVVVDDRESDALWQHKVVSVNGEFK